MKQSLKKVVLGFLSSIFLIQACQTPNTINYGLDLNNKNKNSFNIKADPLCGEQWSLSITYSDDDSYAYVNGNLVLSVPVRGSQEIININSFLNQGANSIHFETSNNGECPSCLPGQFPYGWTYNVYRNGQIYYTDTNGGYDSNNTTYSKDVNINAYLQPCPSPTPTPEPTPTIPPNTLDCSQKSINNFNQNIDDVTDALNKLNNLFSAISPTSGFSTKGFYNSPMYDQGEYRDSLQKLQDRLQEVKDMQFSFDEAERQAWAESQQKLNQVALLAAGLVTGGMAAAPGFITTLAGASPEVILLAMESPQIVNALGQAATLITALKILKNSQLCVSPALSTGVNQVKSGLGSIDDTLNGIVKAVGKSTGAYISKVKISPVFPDWATKGAHISLKELGGKEVTLLSDGKNIIVNNGPGSKPINETTIGAVKEVKNALTDSKWIDKLKNNISKSLDSLNDPKWNISDKEGARSRLTNMMNALNTPEQISVTLGGKIGTLP